VKRRQSLRAIVVLAALAAQTPGAVAQATGKKYVIGLLDGGERLEWWGAFVQQMRDLGYVEGRNVRYERRYAKGQNEALPGLAKQLVDARVDLVVTSGGSAAVAAKRASSKIPIVMASGTDQVSLGLASSLPHPGGNVTGVSTLNSDLTAKRLELLRETVPKISRVAVVWHTDNPPSAPAVRDLETATASSRIGFQSFGVASTSDMSDAFAAMSRDRVDAVLVINAPFIYAERSTISDLAKKYKVPAMYSAAEYVEAGGLISYGPSYPDMFRRAAVFVDKILNGANPGDMPIEQPTTFEMVVNLRTARSIGVSIPPALLARANRVIQ
jgi:putative ABC transport system substrate-binding protein